MKYPITHISYSCLDLWQNCRWCWKERYLKNVRQAPNEAMLNGLKMHKETDNYHKFKPYDKTLLEPYTRKYDPYYREVSELRFNLFLWGLDIPFFGFMDGLKEEEKRVNDLKYGNSCPSLDKSIQGILYSVIYKQIHGEYPLFVINHWHPKTNKIKNIAHQYNEQDEEWLKEFVAKFLEEISGNFRIDGNPYYYGHLDNCPFK